eukprot:3004133-Rhodomonas_salina.1
MASAEAAYRDAVDEESEERRELWQNQPPGRQVSDRDADGEEGDANDGNHHVHRACTRRIRTCVSEYETTRAMATEDCASTWQVTDRGCRLDTQRRSLHGGGVCRPRADNCPRCQ